MASYSLSFRSFFAVATIMALSACSKTETGEKPVIEVPKVQTVQVPVFLPGSTKVVSVPETVIIDKGFGISSLPKEIHQAPENIQSLSKAVAKVMSLGGASGSGFFISEDGLFLTNEHVIPRDACVSDSCPGFKIVLNFTKSGSPQVFYKFKVIAQDILSNDFDFTLVKVELKDGEKVPFLPLELDDSAYAFSDTTTTDRYKVLGHPGGATLKFTNARPISKKEMNITFQGLVVSGNSGGPLVDTETGKVVGLVKSTRTGFVKLNDDTATHHTENRSTSIRDLALLLKAEVGDKLTSVIGLNTLDVLNIAKTGGFEARSVRPKPSLDIFSGALRRPSADVKRRGAISAFDLYIGTEQETAVLDLMFVQNDYTPDDIQIDALTSIFQKQVGIGRTLKFSPSAKKQIESRLSLQPGEETSDKMTASILYNYFDEQKRKQQQTDCMSALPNVPEIASTLIYLCGSIEGKDKSRLIPIAVNFFLDSKMSELEDFGRVTGFFMFAGVVGTSNPVDIEAIEKLDSFVDKKITDIEFLMQNDSFAMNLAKGLVGVGTYGPTFP